MFELSIHCVSRVKFHWSFFFPSNRKAVIINNYYSFSKTETTTAKAYIYVCMCVLCHGIALRSRIRKSTAYKNVSSDCTYPLKSFGYNLCMYVCVCIENTINRNQLIFMHLLKLPEKKNSPNVFYGKYMFPFPSNSNNNNKKTRLGFNFILTNDFLKKAFFKSFYISFAWFDLIWLDMTICQTFDTIYVKWEKERKNKQKNTSPNKIE